MDPLEAHTYGKGPESIDAEGATVTRRIESVEENKPTKKTAKPQKYTTSIVPKVIRYILPKAVKSEPGASDDDVEEVTSKPVKPPMGKKSRTAI